MHGKKPTSYANLFRTHVFLTLPIARTLQESLLSRRLLVFTDHQTSFHCVASSWTESLGDPSLSIESRMLNDWHSVTFFGYLAQLTTPIWNWNHFAYIVEMSSQRQISIETDVLASFIGVLNFIQQLRPATRSLSGLPFFYTEELSGLVVIDSQESLVATALSWAHDSPCRRRSVFPSWTWAGWIGGVKFWRRGVVDQRTATFVREVLFESSCVQECAFGNSSQKKMSQAQLDTVTLIQFEALVISADSFSILQDDPYDTEMCRLEVMGHRVPIWEFQGHDEIKTLVTNVRQGIWSCFMLCGGRQVTSHDAEEEYSTFVLVVCWKNNGLTAERVGSFSILSNTSENARFGILREMDWEWRRLRLI